MVAVDHKPLTKIFNDRPLDSIDNPIFLKLKEKTLVYQFDIMHILVKRMVHVFFLYKQLSCLGLRLRSAQNLRYFLEGLVFRKIS